MWPKIEIQIECMRRHAGKRKLFRKWQCGEIAQAVLCTHEMVSRYLREKRGDAID